MDQGKDLRENNNIYESIARFEIQGHVDEVRTYCALPNHDRSFGCPVQLSLTASPVEFTISYDMTGDRIVRIGEHGTSSLLDTIRKACAMCRYNKLNANAR